MSIDPVDHDLNRYLAEQDRAQARGEAIDEIVDEILADDCKGVLLQTIVAAWIAQDEDAHKTISAAIASGDVDTIKDDAAFRALVETEAEKVLERRDRAAEDARGEAMYEAQQAAREGW
jgi:hypothetical protein